MSTLVNQTPAIPLADSAHKVGCPANRVEAYEAERPGEDGAQLVTVVRCADCGGQQIHKGGIARVTRKINKSGDTNDVVTTRSATDARTTRAKHNEE